MINKKTLEHIHYAEISSMDMRLSPLRPSTDIVYCKTLVEAAKGTLMWLNLLIRIHFR